jgi:hypothetical protein
MARAAQRYWHSSTGQCNANPGIRAKIEQLEGRQERAPLVGGAELTSRGTDATATEELTGKGGAIEAAQHRAASVLKQDGRPQPRPQGADGL